MGHQSSKYQREETRHVLNQMYSAGQNYIACNHSQRPRYSRTEEPVYEPEIPCPTENHYTNPQLQTSSNSQTDSTIFGLQRLVSYDHHYAGIGHRSTNRRTNVSEYEPQIQASTEHHDASICLQPCKGKTDGSIYASQRFTFPERHYANLRQVSSNIQRDKSVYEPEREASTKHRYAGICKHSCTRQVDASEIESQREDSNEHPYDSVCEQSWNRQAYGSIYDSQSPTDYEHHYATPGQQSSHNQGHMSVYESNSLVSFENHYVSTDKFSSTSQKSIYLSQRLDPIDSHCASPDIPGHIYDTVTKHTEQDILNLKGHLHLCTITVVPKNMSKALKIHSKRKYNLQVKDLSICLSEEHVSEPLRVWTLNSIRRFYVDPERKHLVFEPGRQATTRPIMMKCHFQEDFRDLLQDISTCTGLKFHSEK